ncbi:predicted GPI-anchored protein 58 [Bufo gargarizans]|uniref:predicted GPI-anchored protein 58 n=1 Tax=Bufo gargarizans TaxID=30331 RepID=UPI001CF37D51|nr:predicted GPI-anchored protein 58 [Bufo gargarizans]
MAAVSKPVPAEEDVATPVQTSEAVDPSAATDSVNRTAASVKPAPAETTASQAVQALNIPATPTASAALAKALMTAPIAEAPAHHHETLEPVARPRHQVGADALPEAQARSEKAPTPLPLGPDTPDRPKPAPLSTPTGAAEAAGAPTPLPRGDSPRPSHINLEVQLEIASLTTKTVPGTATRGQWSSITAAGATYIMPLTTAKMESEKDCPVDIVIDSRDFQPLKQ